MKLPTLTRRDFLGKLPVAAAAATPAIVIAANATIAADPETVLREGLPLAAVHIDRAVKAMGDFHWGRWEVTIRSGEPDQVWGFRQLVSRPAGNSRVQRLIDMHESAEATFADSIDAADKTHPDYGGPPAEARSSRLMHRSDDVLRLLLAEPVSGPADVRAKVTYLLGLKDNWHADEDMVEMLLRSLVAADGGLF